MYELISFASMSNARGAIEERLLYTSADLLSKVDHGRDMEIGETKSLFKNSQQN